MNAMWASSAVGFAGASWLAWAVRGRSSSVFGHSTYRGTSGRNSIALTFDDGPSESTPALLEVLGKHNVKATFFMCGANVERCPEIARQVAYAGHEIGNHSYSHTRLDFKSGEFMYKDLARAQQTIQKVTAVRPVWFRAPYGVRWFGLGGVQQSLGLRGAMWTLIARDWRLPTEEIANRVFSGAMPGAVICLHDGRELRSKPDVRSTVEGTALVLPRLLALGYQFETVSEITGR